MKDTQNEIKQNVHGTNSDRKETKTQSNYLEQKEEINIQLEQNEETRIQKISERLRNLWDNLKRSNIRIIGVPEGEQQQEIENLFEQIMKENFPNMTKEIDFQEVQEAQSPKEVGPKEEHTKAHHNSILQDETEGENLRSSKRKGDSYLQRSSHKTQLIFQKKSYRQEWAGKKYSKS